MRRGENDRRGAVNRVDARGENLNGTCARRASYRKLHFCAMRFADPVFLHQDDALGPSTFELL